MEIISRLRRRIRARMLHSEKRRLQFVLRITKISNPRLGAPRMISSFMEQLLDFYEADDCIVLMADPGETEVRMRRVNRTTPRGGDHALMISEDLVSRFLQLPPDTAVLRRSGIRSRFRRQNGYFEYDIRQEKPTVQAKGRIEKVAAILDASCFLSVPLCYHSETIGRIYLTSNVNCFEKSDVGFLLQVFEYFMPLIDNIRLVDRLSTDSSFAERKKIARDLHDTVLQPYIGLKLGIASLRQKLEARTLQMRDIDRLIEVNEQAIDELRRYVSVLNGKVEQEGDLLVSLRRFVDRFSFATGISVDLDAGDLSPVDGRLAAEALKIVSEGLSNIRRHTDSTKSRIYLGCRRRRLEIRIEDPGGSAAAGKLFRPRSISERAEALGGKTFVETMSHGGSRVLVEVPL